ncbi:putative S-adenosyl-L-methionine-dependent methyltransferase [Helianthus debilis subsp. tardiflorus]
MTRMVCDDRYSELIPCLDRHLIYQVRLKLDLSLMEHHERNSPLPDRRFNCLIPLPNGYKVRFYSIEVENGRVGYRVIHVTYGTLSNGLD